MTYSICYRIFQNVSSVFFLLMLFDFTLNAEIFAMVLETAVRIVCCETEEHAKTPSLRQRIVWYLYI